jgi:hypothetical protein
MRVAFLLHILEVRFQVSAWLADIRTELLNAFGQITYILTYQVGTLQFSSTSLAIHYLLIVVSSGPVQSELLPVSVSDP